MTLRTHRSADFSEAIAARRERACYHLDLTRTWNPNERAWSDWWKCTHCGARVSAVIQKEEANADLRENQRI